MITRTWLINRSERGKNRDGGKAKLGERTHYYACSSSKELCTGKYNSKVDSWVHSTPDGAMKCILKSAKLLAAGGVE